MQIDCHVLPHLILMGRFRQHRGWGHNGRTMSDHLLMVMWQGECDVTVTNKAYHLERGDAMVIPAGEHYRPRTEKGCEYYYFHFETTPTQQDTLSQRTISLPFCISAASEDQQEILLLSQRIYDMQPVTGGNSSVLTADLTLTQLLVLLSNLASQAAGRDFLPPALLGKLVLYIRQHITEKITLAELSSHFSVSKQYIARLFRLHLNTTPTAYIHRTKLETARFLLTHSTMNVTEISDYLGFSECYYFIRLFKKYYNVTPLQYTREILGRG